MLKRNFKRLVAMLLTATMVISSSAFAYAETIENTGDVEGWVNKKVFSVVLPTASANALKMLVDPQKLIASTNAAAKEGLSANDFADGTVLFPRSDADGSRVKKYDTTSETISMANVGTVSVNIAVTAAVTEATGIILSANGSTIGAYKTGPAMYVQMNKGHLPTAPVSTYNTTAWSNAQSGGTDAAGGTDAIMISGNGAGTKNVAVSADKVAGVVSLYTVSYNSSEKKYTYGISKNSVSSAKALALGDGFKFSFGAATNDGDLIGWKSLTSAKPKLSLTYTITKLDNDADEQALPGEATILSSTYDETKRVYRIIMPSGVTINSVGDIENFKFNGIDITSSLGSFASLTQAKDQVRMDKDSIKAVPALSEFWAGSTQTFTITFTYDGVDYSSVVTR